MTLELLIFILFFLNLKVDKSALITLPLYFLVTLLRIVSYLAYQELINFPWFSFLHVVSQAVIWTTLYYFTFEMEKIKIALEAENVEGLKRRRGRFEFKYIVLMSMPLVLMLVQGVIIYQIRKMSYQKNKEDIRRYNQYLLWIKIIRFLADTYAHILFLQLYIFFENQKK